MNTVSVKTDHVFIWSVLMVTDSSVLRLTYKNHLFVQSQVRVKTDHLSRVKSELRLTICPESSQS